MVERRRLKVTFDPITDAPVVTPEEAAAPANNNEYLDKLAKLGVLEYEQQRKLAAKELNVRPSVLDKLVSERKELNKELNEASAFMVPVQPWPKPVDGNNLLHDLCDTLERHLVLPEKTRGPEATALWIVHCHAHDAARHSPILFATSPTKQCGKTNLLATLSMVVPKPAPSGCERYARDRVPRHRSLASDDFALR